MKQFARYNYAKGLSLKTIKWYDFNLKKFKQFLDGQELYAASAEQVKGYILFLTDQGYSKDSIKGAITTLRVYYNFLMDNHIITINPTQGLTKPKSGKKIIYSLTPEEMTDIMNVYAGRTDTFLNCRNGTILSILFATGIRKSELLSIKHADILDDFTSLKIHGKGDKERIVPISKSLRNQLKYYLKRLLKYQNENNIKPIQNIMINVKGEPLTESGVNRIFNELKHLKRSWSTRVSAHTIRHTFALYYLRNGGDVFSLQRIMGHADLSTTKIYIELARTDLRYAMDKFCPLDNNSWQLF